MATRITDEMVRQIVERQKANRAAEAINKIHGAPVRQVPMTTDDDFEADFAHWAEQTYDPDSPF
jgi:hypothetical protein